MNTPYEIMLENTPPEVMDNFRLEFYDSLPFDHTTVNADDLESDFQNYMNTIDLGPDGTIGENT